MRKIRIYQPGSYEVGQIIELNREAAHHVGVVLRMQPGNQLTLFCGNNQEYRAEITSMMKKKIEVKILSVEAVNCESPCAIHLAQAISKGDRMEMVVQKAVELGVASITPLLTEHCAIKFDQARFAKKQAQWQAIAIAACEQSGRNVVPLIQPVISLEGYLGQSLPTLKIVLDPQASNSWQTLDKNTSALCLLIGPEGGLSARELKQLVAHQFYPLSLGPRILRTETAAIVALGLLQAVCGDL